MSPSDSDTQKQHFRMGMDFAPCSSRCSRPLKVSYILTQRGLDGESGFWISGGHGGPVNSAGISADQVLSWPHVGQGHPLKTLLHFGHNTASEGSRHAWTLGDVQNCLLTRAAVAPALQTQSFQIPIARGLLLWCSGLKASTQIPLPGSQLWLHSWQPVPTSANGFISLFLTLMQMTVQGCNFQNQNLRNGLFITHLAAKHDRTWPSCCRANENYRSVSIFTWPTRHEASWKRLVTECGPGHCSVT